MKINLGLGNKEGSSGGWKPLLIGLLVGAGIVLLIFFLVEPDKVPLKDYTQEKEKVEKYVDSMKVQRALSTALEDTITKYKKRLETYSDLEDQINQKFDEDENALKDAPLDKRIQFFSDWLNSE